MVITGEAANFSEWCLVELFGHTQIIGKVTQATIGGCSFIRVDVPENGSDPAYTRYLGQGAIYAINPITEETAILLMSQCQSAPPHAWKVTVALEEKARELAAYDDESDRAF
jgi:hypothetical protein